MQKKNESDHALPVITSLALNLFPCSWIESAGEHLISSLRYIYIQYMHMAVAQKMAMNRSAVIHMDQEYGSPVNFNP